MGRRSERVYNLFICALSNEFSFKWNNKELLNYHFKSLFHIWKISYIVHISVIQYLLMWIFHNQNFSQLGGISKLPHPQWFLNILSWTLRGDFTRFNCNHNCLNVLISSVVCIISATAVTALCFYLLLMLFNNFEASTTWLVESLFWFQPNSWINSDVFW